MTEAKVAVLDTSALLDLRLLDPAALPGLCTITSITVAELHHGVAMASNANVASARRELLMAALVDYDPLPFDVPAAQRYGSLVARTVAAGRSPRPRRIDLMIAAIASIHGMPLITRNGDDFVGLAPDVEVVVV